MPRISVLRSGSSFFVVIGAKSTSVAVFLDPVIKPALTEVSHKMRFAGYFYASKISLEL